MEHTSITSFDGTEINKTRVLRAQNLSEILSLQLSKMIARGAGLSYCNASVLEEGVCIDLQSFNHILNFDPAKETVTAEAGISIGYLSNFTVSKGYILPVMPGYPAITIGGCMAFNVHSKSQYGTFIDCVEEFSLYHPVHGTMTCSRTQNKEIFELTIGGMGLTGIIISATLKLKKIACNSIITKAVKARNITEAICLMRENKDAYDYIYSYNNLNERGTAFGKGFVYFAKHTKEFKQVKSTEFRNRFKEPQNKFNLASPVILRLLSNVYYSLQLIQPNIREASITEALFPIYGKEFFYNFFGNRGLREYQVLFPFQQWENARDEVKKLIASVNVAIGLGSMKILNSKPHHLSFSGEGVCLTLDIANNEKGMQFLRSMDEITLKYKGIINLSKDSRAPVELVSALFPGYSTFRQQIHAFDINRTFASELSKRIGI